MTRVKLGITSTLVSYVCEHIYDVTLLLSTLKYLETYSTGGKYKGYFLLAQSETKVHPKKDFLFVYRTCRLRVVPLSLGPSCVTRKKTARKGWPRGLVGARSTQVSPPGFHAAIFFSRFIYGLAWRTKRGRDYLKSTRRAVDKPNFVRLSVFCHSWIKMLIG